MTLHPASAIIGSKRGFKGALSRVSVFVLIAVEALHNLELWGELLWHVMDILLLLLFPDYPRLSARTSLCLSTSYLCFPFDTGPSAFIHCTTHTSSLILSVQSTCFPDVFQCVFNDLRIP